ncbi:rod-binding protein [bacterium]|nr:rod-binding protein [bacterium]MBU1883834.1 rod-binding protein [bacterium]
MSSSINSAYLQQAMLSQDVASTPKIVATTDDKKLREQTDAFESVIIKMMMDNAMKDEKNLFGSQNDPGDKIYKSMYRDELSKASAGSFGFSQMLYDYLSQKSGKIN